MITWISLGLAVAGCGEGEDDSSDGGAAEDGGNGGNGGGCGGSATLTIGEQTWEFDWFCCAVGLEETQSQIFSLVTDSRGEHEGARVQMQAEVQDDSGQGRLTGLDVIYTIYIRDIENFSEPTISFESTTLVNPVLVKAGLAPPSSETVVTLSGNQVTGEGLFDDQLTEDDFTQVAGTLVGTCGNR